MPTFTAIALDRLIEPGAAKSMTTVTNVSDSKLDRRNNTINSKLERMNSTSTTTTLDKKHHWAMIKPALYATPKSTPLPDSPSTPLPDSPSPYVVDHKRRGPRLLKSYSEDDVAARKRAPEEEKVGDNTKVAGKETTDLTEDVAYSVTCPVEQEHVNGISSGEPVISELSSSLAAQNGSAVQNGSAKSVEEGGELEDFLDPQDSMSAKSNTEGDSNSGVERSLYQTTPVAEFYDAWEELSSDNGRQPPPLDIECELREIRLSLFMEIENRKQAEEALDNMRSQWLRIRQQLSFVGLTLPAEPISLAEDERLGVDPVEELCRQVYLARFVSHSIGRGTAKAEVEMEMETHIESKNFEIARLWDKLHYYEAVNREMSQRNQEAVGKI
ncbi:hypothetical protein C3L33_01094, partial [Rhododendron williamsianum]